jgi:eukaryotic-like serine/threonine-protein kinase
VSESSNTGTGTGEVPFPAGQETQAPDAEADLLIGTVLAGRYRILRKLGEGAMGAVYLGEHLKIGRRDAIKVLRGPLVKDAESIARFNRGARNVAAIQHPNVCTIYDYSDTDDGLPFLAMEFVSGESLKELLDSEGPLPVGRTTRIARQVAEALYAAHSAGIVHRDLKPGNVMLMYRRDGTDEVRVVDFDIAKGSQEGEESEVTRLGFVIGTPEYMSPEQLMAEKLDGRSDVYSLGILVFRMLTGVLPFQGTTPHEIVFQRLSNPPLRLDQVLPGTQFPPKLQAVLDRALQRSPVDRHPSAAEFGRELAEATAGVEDAPKLGEVRLSATGIISGHLPVSRPARGDVPETQLSEAPVSETVTSPQVASAPAGDRRPALGGRRTQIAAAGMLLLTTVGGVGWFAMSRTPQTTEPGTVSEATVDTPPLLARVAEEGFPTTAPAAPPAQPEQPQPPPAAAETRETTQPPSGPAPGPATAVQPDVSPPRSAEPPPPRESAGIAQTWLREQVLNLEPGFSSREYTTRRERAIGFYRHPDLNSDARAQAAYVVALTWQYQGDNPQCRTWAQRALELNAANRGYNRIYQECSAGY